MKVVRNSGNRILNVSFSFVASMGRHILKSFSICNKVKKSRKVIKKIVSWLGDDTFFDLVTSFGTVKKVFWTYIYDCSIKNQFDRKYFIFAIINIFCYIYLFTTCHQTYTRIRSRDVSFLKPDHDQKKIKTILPKASIRIQDGYIRDA